MVLKIFTQPSCPKCPAAKALVDQLKVKNEKLKIEEYDVLTVDGLTEASFYSVFSTPSLILCDDQGKEIRGWRGKVPSKKELKSQITNPKPQTSSNI